MAHGVDAVPHRMEPARPNASVDLFFAETTLEQLPPRHHPVLPPREDR